MKFTETRQVEIPESVFETDVVGRLVNDKGKVKKPIGPAGVKILSDRLEFRFDYPITKTGFYTAHEIDLFNRTRRIQMSQAVVVNGDTLSVTHKVSIYHMNKCCHCCG